MQIVALLLSLSFAIQNYADGCTLLLCPPCHYVCVKDGVENLGADCKGYRGCHEECPKGTYSIPSKPCKHVFIFCIRSNDITQNNILLEIPHTCHIYSIF